MDSTETPAVPASKTVHKRAAKACLGCRSRKVRCDLVLHPGASCTNCQLDGVKCVVEASRRSKHSLPGNMGLVSQSNLISEEGQIHGSKNDQIGDQRLFSRTDVHFPVNTPEPALPTRSADQASSASSTGKSGIIAFKPAPSTMNTEDIEYLKLKGAFSPPSEDFRRQLLQSYLNFVHPYNPVLNMSDIHAMGGCCETGQVSCLLFQAVMLGGSLFVEDKHLKNSGYSTRKAARQVFYDRARVLYERDYEQDVFVITQALLLMSLWYETPSSHKNCWYWSGLAIDLIKCNDLSKTQENAEMQSWARLWWVGFVRDRLIALGMKLPVRLKLEDCEVRMLERDDLDLGELPYHLFGSLDSYKLSWKAEQGHQLSLMYIEEVKLCICIDRFLSVLRAEGRSVESVARELQLSEKELGDWHSSLPQESKLDLSQSSELDPILAVHRAVLRMVQLCAVAFVQRARLRMLVPGTPLSKPKDQEIQESARAKIRIAATNMAEMARYLRENDLVRYLPHSAVISFIHVNLIYLLDLTAVNNINGISQSMRTMEVLRDSYFDTEYGTRLVNSVFERELKHISPPESESRADARDISEPRVPLTEVSISGGNSTLDNLPSHEWIVGELQAFTDSTSSAWDSWQQDISDVVLSSQLDSHQLDLLPTEIARVDLAINVPDPVEQESLSTKGASNQNSTNPLDFEVCDDMELSTYFPEDSWHISAAPEDSEFDYNSQMDF